MDYKKYLKSYEWQIKRERALKYAGYRCQICNSEVRLEVHHRTYDNLGDEQPSDLTVLCHDCHKRHSDRMQKPNIQMIAWWDGVLKEINKND